MRRIQAAWRMWGLLPPLALCALGCRAFPVGMLVPRPVQDALASTRYEESLEESGLEATLVERAGLPLLPAEDTDTYWRLDGERPLGPLEVSDFDRPGQPATRGLAAGDLVLVKNGRPQGLATTLALAEFTFYDHVGILVAREGAWFVCDSWPSFRLLVKASDFADRFRGGVRATPLGRFLGHYETLFVLRLPNAERRERLATEALASLQEGIEFDPHHDPDDARLSCSEFVAALLERSGQEAPKRPRPLVEDQEMRTLVSALGFPPGGFLVPDQFAEAPGVRPVAWISRRASPSAALGIEAAFELLHARFLHQGRVGDFLGIDRLRFLRYRDNVASFLRWTEAWSSAHSFQDRAEALDSIATIEALFFVEAE